MKNDEEKNKKVASDATEEAESNSVESENKKDATSNVAVEDESQKKIEECELKYKRALADYQNLQKRVHEEKIDWIRGANKELLLRFLPVLDTLILANKHVENQGLAVSIQQFLDVLKSEGVTRIETVGKEFDPHLMECIAVGEGETDKVLEEIRTGYLQYDKILRPAQVQVGKKE